MSKTVNRRIQSLDNLKLLAIFLVVWGHAIQHLTIDNFEYDKLYHLIYCFHMPLFALISGCFAWNSKNSSILELLKKNFTHYLLPCISWGVLIYILIAIKHEVFCISELLDILMSDFWVFKNHFFVLFMWKID